MKEKEAPRPEWDDTGSFFRWSASVEAYHTTVPLQGLIEQLDGLMQWRAHIWNRTRGEYDIVDDFPTKEAAQQFVEISYRLDSAEAP
jgi:hypothetical protein